MFMIELHVDIKRDLSLLNLCEIAIMLKRVKLTQVGLAIVETDAEMINPAYSMIHSK